MLKWIRPSTVKFPTVWRTFKGKNDLDGRQKEYWIQDFTKEFQDEAIQYTSLFLKDEPLIKFFGTSHDTVIKELIKTWTHILDQNVCIVCLTKDENSNPTFAGINFTMVLSRNDTIYTSNNEDITNLFEVFRYFDKEVDPFKVFNAKEYLSAFGLFVLPEHRGNGIGYNFLEASTIMSTWKRPTWVPFPNIWAKFEGNITRNGVKNMYWIQEVTEEYRDKVVELMVENFTRDEPLSKYANIQQDAQAMNDFRHVWSEAFKQHLGLMCLTKDSEGVTHIAGINCNVRCGKEENTNLQLTSDNSRRVLKSLTYPKGKVNVYEKFNITEYLEGMGLLVLPAYRGEGIGVALLKAREPLCRALGFKASLTVFSSKFSQGAAKRAGFEDVFTIDYDKLEEEIPFMRFPGIQEHTKALHWMYILYK